MRKTTKLGIALIALAIAFPSGVSAQNSISDLANSTNELVNSTKELIGLFKRKTPKNKEVSENYVGAASGEAATVGYTAAEVSSASAAPGAFRLVTGHPDFKIKVLRCEAAGKTCVIDMIVENVGSNDVRIVFRPDYAVAYDDEANEYKGIKMAIGSSSLQEYHDINLLSEVPVKARIQISGVRESATMIRRMDMWVKSSAWNLDSNIKFMNVPISREGDE